jgi:hypothetical protein
VSTPDAHGLRLQASSASSGSSGASSLLQVPPGTITRLSDYTGYPHDIVYLHNPIYEHTSWLWSSTTAADAAVLPFQHDMLTPSTICSPHHAPQWHHDTRHMTSHAGQQRSGVPCTFAAEKGLADQVLGLEQSAAAAAEQVAQREGVLGQQTREALRRKR